MYSLKVSQGELQIDVIGVEALHIVNRGSDQVN